MYDTNEEPSLYDFNIYSVDRDGKKTLEKSVKGLFNYEKNIFEVPRKFVKMFQYKRKIDFEIMQTVGMEIV